MSQCVIDGSPTGDGSLLCAAHRNRLEQRIAEMPALARELELTLTRQSSAGERHGGRSADKPLPYDVGASDVNALLHATLTYLVRDLRGTDTWPINITTPGLANWLRAHIDRIVQNDAAGEILEELDHLAAHGWRCVDRRAPVRLYAGRCDVDDCPEDIYAHPLATTALCRRCGIEHNIPERRATMLAALEDHLLTADEMVSLLPVLGGFNLTIRRMRVWVSRGRKCSGHPCVGAHLHSAGATLPGEPTYRVADVRKLLAIDQRHTAA